MAAQAWLALDGPNELDRVDEAATLLVESDSRYLGQILVEAAATMSAHAKDWPQAARLLGAAGALERASDRSDGRLVRPREEELHAQARSALGLKRVTRRCRKESGWRTRKLSGWLARSCRVPLKRIRIVPFSL